MEEEGRNRERENEKEGPSIMLLLVYFTGCQVLSSWAATATGKRVCHVTLIVNLIGQKSSDWNKDNTEG